MVLRADLTHSASCRYEKSSLIPPTDFQFPRHFVALRFYVLVLFPRACYITREGKVEIVRALAVKACSEGGHRYSCSHYE